MKKVRNILILIFVIIAVTLYGQNRDATSDSSSSENEKYKKRLSSILSDDFNPKEELKEPKVLFDAGFNLIANSRILFKYFDINAYGITPIPTDKWTGDLAAQLWSKLIFGQGRYLYLNMQADIVAEQVVYNEVKLNAIIPMFNIESFMLHWDYSIGKVILGRTNYSLKSNLVFSGPLDGIELDINVPHFNFKTFVGFTGILGIFNPRYNPYRITSLESSYQESSNLLYFSTIIKINDTQSRRIFYGADFDITFFNQHINPYFLLQFDLSSLYSNLDRSYEVNTFHIGLNNEGRIASGLYYKINVVSLFGTTPTSTKDKFSSIISFAVESNLRYTIRRAKDLTFVVGYAFGYGNDEDKDNWSDSSTDKDKGFWSDKFDSGINNKFFYFGRFDGGFVLNPILSNIHSGMFKVLISPINKGSFHMTLYASYYQTFKVWPNAPISDDECNLNSYLVGSELDIGMLLNTNSNFFFAFDIGSFLPLLAYTDRSFRFKGGITIGLTF